MHLRLVALTAFLALNTAAAQSRASLTVRVHVVDSANVVLENVAVAVVHGLNELVVSGTTDRNGVRVFHLDPSPEEFQVTARRVGYQPGSRVFSRSARDTLTVDFVLRRIPQRLDTVRVTATQDLKTLKLTVDAEAIASFERPLIDATDIIQKMRPDMIYGLGGRGFCPSSKNIWVNGRRIRGAVSNFMMDAKKHDLMAFAGMRHPPNAYLDLPSDVLAVLASIRPEHIAFIQMRECNDVTVGKIGGEAAIFVTLKEGVTYDVDEGSYVMPPSYADSILKQITLPARVIELHSTYEKYRLRILGLFDAITGAPITGADVTDMASGTRARTTESGTVSLVFLEPGASRVIVNKTGYRSDTLSVFISPADTLPITLVLSRP